MESKVKAFGHPIHPMLIVFPLGLLATSVVFDILYLILDAPDLAVASYWMIAAGVIGGLIAALFGFIDWLAIPSGTRAKSVGLTHGLGNVVVAGLFAVSFFLRMDETNYAPTTAALLLSIAAAAIAVFTGWLGGELVYRLGMAVDPGANLNAPNSLTSAPPATEDRRGMGYERGLAQTGREDQVDDEMDYR